MNSLWKKMLLVFLLGILCPWILIVSLGKKVQPSVDDPISEEPTEAEGHTQSDSETVEVLDQNGKVLSLSLREYLTSVLLCEMPASFEMEALKAQAVVARTYVMRAAQRGGKHASAAVCMNASCCQGYKSVEQYTKSGGNEADIKKIQNAVLQTDGLVLEYNGEMIEATYFSCSGGLTEDAKDVWGADVPYLQSTESPGEEGATHYTETVVFKADELAKKLGRKLFDDPSKWIEKITHTTGGGVKTIRICGVDYSGIKIRQLLSLRSASFTVTTVGDSFVITTRGYGHRVGMSQYGADAMAATGSSFEDILHHYYRDVAIVMYAPED